MIEVNEIETCKLNVKYSADMDLVEKNREEVASQFKGEKVPGFRNGKASLDALKFHFKRQIDEGLKQKMAKAAYDQAIAEKNVRPFGEPEFTNLSLKDNNFECSFIMHTIPDFELKKHKEFEIPKGSAPDPVQMGEMILENLRQQYGETLPFEEEDFVQAGNSVIVNFKAFNQANEEVASKEGELFTIGSAPFACMNENLLGMKMGESREFSSIVNDEGDFKDQTLRFEVSLVMGSKNNPHPIDDELAKKMEVENVDALKTLVQTAASNRVKTLSQRHLFEQVSARLIEEHNFDLPDWLVTAEAKTLARQYEGEWETLPDDRKEVFLKSGRDSVKLALVLDKVRQEEPDAQLTEEETMKILRDKVKENHPHTPEHEVLKNLFSNGQLPMLLTALKDEYAIDFIIKNSQIVE